MGGEGLGLGMGMGLWVQWWWWWIWMELLEWLLLSALIGMMAMVAEKRAMTTIRLCSYSGYIDEMSSKWLYGYDEFESHDHRGRI